MPKRSKVEACMFCGQMPCVCGRKVKPEKPKASKKVAAPERPAMADRMRAGRDAQAARRGSPRAQPDPPTGTSASSVSTPRVIPFRSIEDIVADDCIRTLAPLLADSELEKYRTVLTSTPSADERKRLWKWRREHGSME